jgi:hypothetical protein
MRFRLCTLLILLAMGTIILAPAWIIGSGFPHLLVALIGGMTSYVAWWIGYWVNRRGERFRFVFYELLHGVCICLSAFGGATFAVLLYYTRKWNFMAVPGAILGGLA